MTILLTDFYKWLKDRGYDFYSLNSADKSELYRQFLAEKHDNSSRV